MTAKRSILLAVAALALATPARSLEQDALAEASARLRSGVDRLSFLSGDWDASFFAPTAEGGWKELGQTTMIVATAMNDLYLETKVQSGSYLYEIVFSYDVVEDRYRVISRDDQSGLIDVYEGDFDASGALIVTNIDGGTHYLNGGVRGTNRMTFEQASGGWIWLVEATSDDGATWSPQVKATARAS